jgi:hypothetical protein
MAMAMIRGSLAAHCPLSPRLQVLLRFYRIDPEEITIAAPCELEGQHEAQRDRYRESISEVWNPDWS